jgi:hypothetical protein
MFCQAAVNSAHCLVVGSCLWVMETFGITASGIPSTSAQNSRIRSFSLLLCGAEDVISQGDDEIHRGLVDLELLASCGTITKGKMNTVGPDGPIAFTSHLYTRTAHGWVAAFDNFEKMLAHLDLRRVPGEAPSPDTLAGVRAAVRHSVAQQAILDFVCEHFGWFLPAPSPEPLEDCFA